MKKIFFLVCLLSLTTTTVGFAGNSSWSRSTGLACVSKPAILPASLLVLTGISTSVAKQPLSSPLLREWGRATIGREGTMWSEILPYSFCCLRKKAYLRSRIER